MSQITLSSIPPLTTESPEARQARRTAEKQSRDALGIASGIGDAVNSEWASSWAARQLASTTGMYPDATFTDRLRRDPRLFETLTNGLPADMHSAFGDATSMDDALRIRDDLRSVATSRSNLASMGWTGTALKFGADLLDPVMIAATAATGGLAEPFIAANSATRVGRMVRSGIVNAAAIAPVEVYRATQDPEYGASDVVHSTLGAMLLGGLIGGLGKSELGKAMRDVELADAVGSSTRPMRGFSAHGADDYRFSPSEDTRELLSKIVNSEGGNVYFKEQLGDAAQRAHVENIIHAQGLSDAEAAVLRAEAPEIALRRFFPNDAAAADAAITSAVPPEPKSLPWNWKPEESAIANREMRLRVEMSDSADDVVRREAIRQLTAEARAGVPAEPTKFPRAERPATGPDAEIATLGLPPRSAELPPLTEAEVAGRVELLRADNPGTADADLRTQALREIAQEDAAKGPPRKPPTVAEETPRPPRQAGDWSADAITGDKPGVLGRVGQFFGMSGSLARTNSPLVRMVADGLLNNAIRKPGQRSIVAAETWVNATLRAELGQFYREIEPHVAKRIADYADVLPKGMDPRLAIMEDATRTLRQAPGMIAAGKPMDDPIAKAAAALLKRVRDRAERMGVAGFGEFDNWLGYVPRHYLQEAMDMAVMGFTQKGVEEAFAGALKAGTPGLEDEAAKVAGKLMVKAIRDPSRFGPFGVSRMFDPSQREVLAEIMAESVRDGHMTADEMETALRLTKPKTDAVNLSPRARTRATIDEHYVHEFADGRRLPMQGLLNNNLEDVVARYARDVTGRSAEAELLRAISEKTGQTYETWGSLRDAMTTEMHANGIGADGMNGIRDTIAKLDLGYRAVRGVPLREGESAFWNGLFGNARAYNELSVGGQISFSHLPDLGRALGSGGFKTMLDQIPELGAVVRQATTGRIPNQLGKELEAALGTGVNDVITRRVNLDPLYGDVTANAKLGHVLETANQFQRKWSGLDAVANVTQTMAARVGVANFADYAFTNTLPSAQRLLTLGLTADEARGILSNIRKFAERGDGLLSKQVTALHMERWDGDAAANFTQAMQGWVSRSVMTHDIGSLSAWMTKPTARILLQFRMFPLRAYERTLLSGVQNVADPATWAKFTAASFISGLSYTLRNYANSIGRSDAQDFRDKHLSPTAIGAASMGHNGYLSLFPTISDTVTGRLLDERFFQEQRTTGLSGDAILGNPTIDKMATLGNFGFKVVRQATNAATDKPKSLTEKDWRDAANLLPFRGFTGVRNILDAVTEKLGQK